MSDLANAVPTYQILADVNTTTRKYKQADQAKILDVNYSRRKC